MLQITRLRATGAALAAVAASAARNYRIGLVASEAGYQLTVEVERRILADQ